MFSIISLDSGGKNMPFVSHTFQAYEYETGNHM